MFERRVFVVRRAVAGCFELEIIFIFGVLNDSHGYLCITELRLLNWTEWAAVDER